jgi:hypothetical protein
MLPRSEMYLEQFEIHNSMASLWFVNLLFLAKRLVNKIMILSALASLAVRVN